MDADLRSIATIGVGAADLDDARRTMDAMARGAR